MTLLPFFKYQGTGNDFVLFDNRDGLLKGDESAYFKWLCDRRFGVGGDGVILLNAHADYDFEMDYFNSDGRRSTMCGNGGRCMARFAADLGIVTAQARFLAIDGPHVAEIGPERIKLKMTLPHGFTRLPNGDHWIHTGSPHHVHLVEGPVAAYPVVSEGHRIRYSEAYQPDGTNVNFVEVLGPQAVRVRTYERGVEDETFSCGTGVTAVAEVLARTGGGDGAYTLHTPGGELHVHIKAGHEPWLEGPAVRVFQGMITAPQ
jgi:diaminopimelate epimerase